MAEENFDVSPFGDVRFVVTFPNTTSAMAFAAACEQNGVAGRLVPIPQSMHAGCGAAFGARGPASRYGETRDQLQRMHDFRILGAPSLLFS